MIWPFPEDPVFSFPVFCPGEAEIKSGAKRMFWGFFSIQFLKTFWFQPLCSENHTKLPKVYTAVKATTVVDVPDEAAWSQLRVMQTTPEAGRWVRAQIHLSNESSAQVINLSCRLDHGYSANQKLNQPFLLVMLQPLHHTHWCPVWVCNQWELD